MPRAKTWWPASARRIPCEPRWRKWSKKSWAELLTVKEILEARYKDVQDFEFTIEQRQAVHAADPQRQAHRAGRREDRRRHGQGKADRSRRPPFSASIPASLDQLLHPAFDPKAAKQRRLAKGLPASPGAAVGKLAFTAEEAEERVAAGETDACWSAAKPSRRTSAACTSPREFSPAPAA